MPQFFADATFQDIQEWNRLTTILVFPVDALQDHGPHLPLSTRLERAKAISAYLSDRIESSDNSFQCKILPPLATAMDGPVSSFGTYVRPHVLRDYFVDQIQSLVRLGFTNFLIVTGGSGPRTLVALDEVVQRFSGKSWFKKSKVRVLSLSGALYSGNQVADSPMILNPPEHGGQADTSLGLLLFPEKVKSEWAQLPAVESSKSGIWRSLNFLKRKIGGYWGEPAMAKAESAARDLEVNYGSKVDFILGYFKDGVGGAYFRTPYRYFPLNWTFFPAYILAATFAVLMVLWILWGIKDLFHEF